jgi:hypothetical protein
MHPTVDRLLVESERLFAAGDGHRYVRDSKSFGGVGRGFKPFPCQCSGRCPPQNVQPVMGGQYQQMRLNVGAPLKPSRGCRLGQDC